MKNSKSAAKPSRQARSGEDKSIYNLKAPASFHQYPEPSTADEQYDGQAEFTDPESSRTGSKLKQDREAVSR